MKWRISRVHVSGKGEIWYTNRSWNGELARAGVYKRREDKGTIIPLGRYAIINNTEMTGIAVAAQLKGRPRKRVVLHR